MLAAASASTAFSWALRAVNVAIKGLSIIGIALLVVEVIRTLATVITGMANKSKEAAEKMKNLEKSLKDTNDSIAKQIGLAQTLQEAYESLAKATDHVIELQDKIAETKTKNKDHKNDEEIKKQEAALEDAKANQQKAGEKVINGAEPGQAQQAAIEETYQQNLRAQENAYQNEMSVASPQKKISLMQKRKETLQARIEMGQKSIDARASVEEEEKKRRVRLEELKAKENEIKNLTYKDAYAQYKIDEERNQINEESIQSKADKGNTSVGYEGRAEQIKHLINARSLHTRIGFEKDTKEREKLQREEDTEQSFAGHKMTKEMQGVGDNELSAKYREELTAAARARGFEQNKGQYETEDQGLTTSMKAQQIENDLAEKRATIEAKIAAIKGYGLKRAEEEAALRNELLDAEIAGERAKGENADKNVIAQKEAQKVANNISLGKDRRSEMIAKAEESRQLKSRQATNTGQPGEAIKLQDYDTFASKREELYKRTGDEEYSKKQALAESMADIQSEAIKSQMGPIADSMARIGGGGVAVSDPMMDIAKRQADLLSTIAANTAPKTEAPANQPVQFTY
jgi:uncharacterized protein YoxC